MINEVFRAQFGSSFAITESVLMLSIIRHDRITVRLAGRLVGPCAVDISSESHSSTRIGALRVVAVMKVSLFLTVLLLLAASSVAQDIHYNFDVDTHFENFKTYKWVEIKDAQKVDELKEKEIKNALDVKLTKKHLTKTDARQQIFILAMRRELTRKNNLLPTIPIGTTVPVGIERVGTEVSTDGPRVRFPPSTGDN